MSRTEYMKQLAYLLQDVPDNEKEEALSWYEDYFDEAGPEKEQEVIQTLGSPERVAAIIKDGLNGGNDEAGEYTERGYQDDRFREDNKVPQPRVGNLHEDKDENYRYYEGGEPEKRKRSRGEILLIIMLCIVAFPVLLGAAGGIFGGIMGLLGGVMGVLIVVPVCAFAAIILGVVFVGTGFAKVFLTPGLGFLLLGSGFLAFAVGILLTLACIWVIRKVIPWTLRKFTELCRKIFKKGGYGA